MEDKIIRFSNKKLVRTLLWGLLVLAGISGVLYYQLFLASTTYIFLVLFLSVGIAVIIWVLLKEVIYFINNNKTGLVLNSVGIQYYGTSLGRKMREIDWSDIYELSTGEMYRTRYVFLKIKNPEKYKTRLSSNDKTDLSGHGVPISNEFLDIGFEDLRSLIDEYFAAYHS